MELFVIKMEILLQIIDLPSLSAIGGYLAMFIVSGFMIIVTKEIIFWD